MKTMMKSIVLIPILLLFGSYASAEYEEDECGKFSYSSSRKQAHIFESIPSLGYLGYTTAEGGYRNGYRLALCEIKSGSPKLTYLHFTKADGTKGGEITVSNVGELDWSLSMCGSSSKNILGGGWAFQDDYGWLNQYSCGNGNFFEQVTLLQNRWLKIYTLAGDDTVKGVINQVHNEDSVDWQLLVRGGSGNDIVTTGNYEFSHSAYSLKSVPAFAKIEGDTGNDDIFNNASYWFGDRARDKCIGGAGDDWVQCTRPSAVCTGGSGKDLCDCENEDTCELNP